MKKAKDNGKMKCLDCQKSPCTCDDMPTKKGMKKSKAMVKGKVKMKGY